MAYGEDKYTNMVKKSCDIAAFTEIQASSERHQKMSNLLLCELIKQIKTLNENLYVSLLENGVDLAPVLDIPEAKKDTVVDPVDPNYSELSKVLDITPVIPKADITPPASVSVPKGLFGKLPRHEPSKVSASVVESL